MTGLDLPAVNDGPTPLRGKPRERGYSLVRQAECAGLPAVNDGPTPLRGKPRERGYRLARQSELEGFQGFAPPRISRYD